MEHENDRICSFVKEIKLYIRVLYIVFLFVKSENNNFLKEIKHFVRAFIACETAAKFVRIFEQVKTRDAV